MATMFNTILVLSTLTTHSLAAARTRTAGQARSPIHSGAMQGVIWDTGDLQMGNS
jgi:hypothetical protein